jgi:hypothetical protein
MSTHDGELEERLRRQYWSSFGPSPDPTQIWAQVAKRMEQQTSSDILERDVRRNGHVLRGRPSADVQIGIPERALHPTTPSRGRWPALVALATTLLVIAMGGTVFGLLAAHHRTAVSPTETASTGLPGQAYAIFGIQMLSDTNGWAIGGKGEWSDQQTGVLLHFDGYRWKVVETLAHTRLSSISMISTTEGWVAGDTLHWGQNGQLATAPFLLHYTAGQWLQEAAPLGLGSTTIKMVTANFGWATGFSAPLPVVIPPGSLYASERIALYQDGVWTNTEFPSEVFSDVVWFISPTDGWAIGTSSGSQPTVLTFWHYTSGHWSRTRFAAPAHDIIFGIELTSPTNGWAIGATATGGPVLLHYDGVTWIPISVAPNQPQPVRVTALTVVSPTEIWIEGARSQAAFLLHYTDGIWSEVKAPEGFIAGFNAPEVVSSNDVWVSGSMALDSSGDTSAAIAHYTKSGWTLYT